jgi:hypothetical protein
MNRTFLARAAIVLALLAGLGWQIGDINLSRPMNRLTDFGGIPNDGKADDAAYARAKTAMLAAKQYELIIDVGDFEFDDPITVEPGMKLKGEGWNSKLIYEGTGTFILYENETSIENLTVCGDTGGIVAGSVGIGPQTTDPSDYDRYFTATNVQAKYFEDGIRCKFNGVATILAPYITNCTNGLRLTGRENNAINVIGGEIRECDIGVLSDATTGIVQNFRGLTIEGNNSYGYRNTTNGSTLVTFDGCYFEENDFVGGAGADISCAATGFANSLTIRNCQFRATATALDIGAGIWGDIHGNTFFSNTKSIVLGANARYFRIYGNRFDSTALVYDPAADNAGELNETSVEPAAFGVRGNNLSNDTDELILWLAANPKVAVLPPGTFLISGSLALAEGQELRGSGKGRTIIKAVAATTDPLVTLATDSVLKDLSVIGVSVASSTGVKPQSSAARWRMENCEVSLFSDNVLVDSTITHGTIRCCRLFSGLATNLKVTAGAAGLLVEDCNILDSVRNVHVTGAAQGLKLWANRIRGGSTNGLEVTAATIALNVQGNIFDNNTGTDVLLSTADQQGSMIVGNRFVTTPTSVSIAGADFTIIEGNTFQPGGGGPKSIDITDATARRTDIRANNFLAGAFDYGTHNSGFATALLGRIYSSGTPNGTGPWETGEYVYHSAPASGVTPMGWVCTTGHASSATFVALPTIP